MAYRIECDRCGETESVKAATGTPRQWLQFNDLVRGDGDGGSPKQISGGVFCPSCANDLERWRKPLPRGKAIDPAQFAKMQPV